MIAAKLATMRQGRPGKEENSPVSIPQAAELLHVSDYTVKAARIVQKQAAPELVRAVEEGPRPAPGSATIAG
jgi:hypothetical protein